MAGHNLIIDPESELVFSLSPNEATPRCSMTLRHGGGTDEFIAFKVGAMCYVLCMNSQLPTTLQRILLLQLNATTSSDKQCFYLAAHYEFKKKI